VERVSTVARGDKTSALSALRERMEQQHAMDTEKLKAEIRTLSEESRKLRHGKAQTVESLRSGQRKELAEMKESMKSRKDKHISKKVAPLEDEVARLVEQVADLKRVQANSIERALAEHRVAKTREIDNLRARLEDKRATDVEELEAKVAQLSQANRELKRQGTLDTGKNQLVRKATAKASSSLRDMLRRLLNEMRIALVPRQHAPLDSSEASPSAAMGRLQVRSPLLRRVLLFSFSFG
jgi:outer membrane murein-binding lipoprotein Lpp